MAMGLYHIARAVSFLNNDCSLVSPAGCGTYHSLSQGRLSTASPIAFKLSCCSSLDDMMVASTSC